MTTKYNLTISYFVTVLTICSCGNSGNGKNKSFDTTDSITTIEQQTEIIQTLNIGGTYSFGDNVEKGPVGSLIVYPFTDNSALFFIDICSGAPSYNLGQLFGKMIIKNNVGTYYSKNDDYNINCLLKFGIHTLLERERERAKFCIDRKSWARVIFPVSTRHHLRGLLP